MSGGTSRVVGHCNSLSWPICLFSSFLGMDHYLFAISCMDIRQTTNGTQRITAIAIDGAGNTRGMRRALRRFPLPRAIRHQRWLWAFPPTVGGRECWHRILESDISGIDFSAYFCTFVSLYRASACESPLISLKSEGSKGSSNPINRHDAIRHFIIETVDLKSLLFQCRYSSHQETRHTISNAVQRNLPGLCE